MIKIYDMSKIDQEMKNEFYMFMGKYFAEQTYKKQIEYLVNRDTNVWFVYIINKEVLGFTAINKTNKIVLEHSFVEESSRNNGIWTKLNNVRFDYINKLDMNIIEVYTKVEWLKDKWIKEGFEIFRQTKNFFFLRKVL
jgi:hypothetical protein